MNANDEERQRQRLRLQRQLGLCRALLEEFREGVTADNLREIEVDVERQLRELDEPISR